MKLKEIDFSEPLVITSDNRYFDAKFTFEDYNKEFVCRLDYLPVEMKDKFCMLVKEMQEFINGKIGG
jgi:hypothetical protein